MNERKEGGVEKEEVWEIKRERAERGKGKRGRTRRFEDLKE